MRRAFLTFTLAVSSTLSAAFGAPGTLQASLRTPQGQPVADAVISLTPLDTPAVLPAQIAPVEIAQEDRQYQPYVTPLLVGTRVDFPNRDSIQHHLYSLSKPKRFEKPLYGGGARESVVFDQPGVVTLGCNIHDWMIAYVIVLTTPHFAKSDAAGAAALSGAPAGRYRLDVWHPRIGTPLSQEVTLLADAPTAVELAVTLKPERRVRRAPDSKTGGY